MKDKTKDILDTLEIVIEIVAMSAVTFILVVIGIKILLNSGL